MFNKEMSEWMSFPRSSVRTRSHTLLIHSFTQCTAITWVCLWAMPCAGAVFSTTWSPDARVGKELCQHAFGYWKWSKNGMGKMLWKSARESVKVTFQECLVEQTGFCQAEEKEGPLNHREWHGRSTGCELRHWGMGSFSTWLRNGVVKWRQRSLRGACQCAACEEAWMLCRRTGNPPESGALWVLYERELSSLALSPFSVLSEQCSAWFPCPFACLETAWVSLKNSAKEE